MFISEWRGLKIQLTDSHFSYTEIQERAVFVFRTVVQVLLLKQFGPVDHHVVSPDFISGKKGTW